MGGRGVGDYTSLNRAYWVPMNDEGRGETVGFPIFFGVNRVQGLGSGALVITYQILGVPCYIHSMIGPKANCRITPLVVAGESDLKVVSTHRLHCSFLFIF